MDNGYQDPVNAKNYIDFLNSPSGLLQQQFLWDAILSATPKDPQIKILDAGCGSGWLCQKLIASYPQVYGCDSSNAFINFANSQNLKANFKVCDLTEALPFEKNFFDVCILNMVAPDLNNLDAAFKNIFQTLKLQGKFIVTIPNPAYTYPVAVWKRNILNILLGRKPKLKFKKIQAFQKQIVREFGKYKILSNYYSLEDYKKSAKLAGFHLSDIKEIKSTEDSPNFDLKYQLFRYPLLLLLSFEKLPQ
jgi:SAM-dependent methyltransferase